MSNQGAGFRGRPNKAEDTCYSFWTGSSLRMLGQFLGQDVYGWTLPHQNRHFNLRAQHRIGGFSKEPGPYHPDILHSYFGLCGISLCGLDQQLQPLDVMLGLTKKSAGANNQKLDGSAW